MRSNENLNEDMAIRDLLEGIAHGVSNPLSIILGNYEVMEKYMSKLEKDLRKLQKDNLLDIISSIRNITSEQKNAIDRVKNIINDLRTLVEETHTDYQPANLKTTMSECIKMSKMRFDVIIHEYIENEYLINMPKLNLQQSLFHIISYFVRSGERENEITIAIKIGELSDERLKLAFETEFPLSGQKRHYSLKIASYILQRSDSYIEIESSGRTHTLNLLLPRVHQSNNK